MVSFKATDYAYEVAWSPVDEAFVARVIDFPGLAAHGDSPEEALKEARVAIEGAIEILVEDGDPVPDPRSARTYNGKILLRTSPELHRELVDEAERESVSLNQFIVAVIEARPPRAAPPSAHRRGRAKAKKNIRARL